MRLEEIFGILEIENFRKIPGLTNAINQALNGEEGIAFELYVARALQKEGYKILESNRRRKGKRDADLVVEKDKKKYAVDIKSTDWDRLMATGYPCCDIEKKKEDQKKKIEVIADVLADLNERSKRGEFDGVIFVAAGMPPTDIQGTNLVEMIKKLAELKVVPYKKWEQNQY